MDRRIHMGVRLSNNPPIFSGGVLRADWGLVPYWLKPDQLGKQPCSTISVEKKDDTTNADKAALAKR